MRLFASLDERDRKLLLICLAAVVVLAVVTGLLRAIRIATTIRCPAAI